MRVDSLTEAPPAEPLGDEVRAMSDEEVERRAAEDPDAGLVPAGFWDTATPVEPETKEQVTLRLDREILAHFRRTGRGYQSRINAVLKSYVRAKRQAG